MTEIEWDQIPVANGDAEYGLRGCRIHHRDGCKGRKDGRINGWHVRTGTADELAQCSGLCGHCVRRMEARADG